MYANIIDISSLQNGLAPYKTAQKTWHLGSSLIAIRFNLCKSLITFVFVIYGNWFGGFPMSYMKVNVIFGKYMKIDSRSFGIAFWRKKVMFFSFAIFFKICIFEIVIFSHLVLIQSAQFFCGSNMYKTLFYEEFSTIESMRTENMTSIATIKNKLKREPNSFITIIQFINPNYP